MAATILAGSPSGPASSSGRGSSSWPVPRDDRAGAARRPRRRGAAHGRAGQAAPRARPARHHLLPDLGHGRRRHHRRGRHRRTAGLHLARRPLRDVLHPVGPGQRRAGRGAPGGGRRLRLGPGGLRHLRRLPQLAPLLGGDADVARRVGGRGGVDGAPALHRRAVDDGALRVRHHLRRAGHPGRGRPAPLRQVGADERRDRADRPPLALHPERRPLRDPPRRARDQRRRPLAVDRRADRGGARAHLLLRRRRAAVRRRGGDGRPAARRARGDRPRRRGPGPHVRHPDPGRPRRPPGSQHHLVARADRRHADRVHGLRRIGRQPGRRPR